MNHCGGCARSGGGGGVKGRGREAAVIEGRICDVMLIVQHSSRDVLRVGCNHLILAKYIQDNKMKFSLLWYETLYPGKTIRV